MRTTKETPNYCLRRSVFLGAVAVTTAIGSHLACDAVGESDSHQPAQKSPISRTCVPGPETFVIEEGNIHEVWEQATKLSPNDVNQGVSDLAAVNEWVSPSLVQPGTYVIPDCTTNNQ